MAIPSSVSVSELPLFPLPEVVLFPSRPLPLHIFEPRYRLMVNTVLEGEGAFGVLLFDPASQKPKRIGCSAEIVDCVKLPDGRMNIMTIGRKRFRVLQHTQKHPYLIGLVEYFEDSPALSSLKALGSRVEQLLRDVIRLSGKLTDTDILLPDDLPTKPEELSYWIAGNIYGAANDQQELLELLDTEARLSEEADVLLATRNFLAAKSALKDAFRE